MYHGFVTSCKNLLFTCLSFLAWTVGEELTDGTSLNTWMQSGGELNWLWVQHWEDCGSFFLEDIFWIYLHQCGTWIFTDVGTGIGERTFFFDSTPRKLTWSLNYPLGEEKTFTNHYLCGFHWSSLFKDNWFNGLSINGVICVDEFVRFTDPYRQGFCIFKHVPVHSIGIRSIDCAYCTS